MSAPRSKDGHKPRAKRSPPHARVPTAGKFLSSSFEPRTKFRKQFPISPDRCRGRHRPHESPNKNESISLAKVSVCEATSVVERIRFTDLRGGPSRLEKPRRDLRWDWVG